MTNRERETLNIAKSMLSHEAQSRQGEFTEVLESIRPKTRLEQYDDEIALARSIFIDRNAIYKDTFVHLGLLGTTVTLVGDVFRLRNMIIHEPDHGRSYVEAIEDKLLDVINQSVISLMMLREQNYEGK